MLQQLFAHERQTNINLALSAQHRLFMQIKKVLLILQILACQVGTYIHTFPPQLKRKYCRLFRKRKRIVLLLFIESSIQNSSVSVPRMGVANLFTGTHVYKPSTVERIKFFSILLNFSVSVRVVHPMGERTAKLHRNLRVR